MMLVALTSTPVLAKGATEARLNGPGLSEPLVLGGDGEPGSGGKLARLAEQAGLFAAMFDQIPDPLKPERPHGRLGPRFTMTYVVPGPEGEDEIVQRFYPYADAGMVVFTPGGQTFFGTEETRQGWVTASDSLRSLLEADALPTREPATEAVPSSTTSEHSPNWPLIIVAVFGGLLGAQALRLMVGRSSATTR
jgi:hypothetical protein